jgi:hypothetical protein
MIHGSFPSSADFNVDSSWQHVRREAEARHVGNGGAATYSAAFHVAGTETAKATDRQQGLPGLT